jgi:hypothetical protein
MIKNCLFAMALLSLALAGGCAKGGNGTGSGITVKVNDGNIPAIYPNQHITFTATVTGTTNQTVTWSLSGTACTGTPNPCGTIDKNTGAYVAPAAVPSPATVTITATSAADSTATGAVTVHIVLIAVTVTPTTVTVGNGLEQQFTAIAVPDDAPQKFTWSLTCTTTPCGTLVQDQNTSGLALYTAGSNQAVTVSATSTLDTQRADAVKFSVVASRLTPNSTYGFQFSGYDSSNGNKPVSVVGSVTTGASGSITGGVEDVLPAPPSGNPLIINSGSYVPSSNNVNSNNLGTLTLNLGNGATNTYTAVLTASGSFQMIESGGAITGSGVMQKAAPTQFNSGGQTFAFGFTGMDSSDKRVGYVGMLAMDGNGNITSGMLDSNDNGSDTGVCSSPPCSLLAGSSYTQDSNFPGLWHMVLDLTSGTTQHFDFVLGGGTAQTKTGPNPLTLYAIASDPIDTTHPALSGSMVYQVPGITYNNAAFSGSSVSALTGANANVSLTLGITDGKSSGTGGAGGFTGNFDQNDNGAILSVPAFPPVGATSNPYTYVASSGNIGRYIFLMLGNPTANTVVPPVPFVLYASGANRGFLLDQSSPNVITGAMYPQPAKESGSYGSSQMPGTYAVATNSNSSYSIAPFVQNLLLTSPGGGVFNVAGAQNPGNKPVTGTYAITTFDGTGSITLTAPPPPSVATNAIYAVDAANFVITDFFMIGTTSGTPSSIIFAQQ